MRKQGRKILALEVICFAFLFILSSLFGCASIPFKKAVPEFQSVYNAQLDKTYIIPGMFPNPYDEKEMGNYCYQVFLMSMRQVLIGYWKAANEECEIQKDTIMYGLVFDQWSEDIIAALTYANDNDGRFWVYEDWLHPKACTRTEQEEWLIDYDTNRSRAQSGQINS